MPGPAGRGAPAGQTSQLHRSRAAGTADDASRSPPCLAIIFPITAFVALGFDHVVANMFFLPLAVFENAGNVTAANTVENLVFAFLGKVVGAGVFVAGAYYYLYGKDRPRPVAA